MTIKELKEKISQFPEDLIVMIPNSNWNPYGNKPPDVPATSVSRGANEADGCVFIDDYKKD